MDDVVQKQRESSLGYHFIHLYQDCPRKWYLKYILGIMPKRVGKALIFGKAWHSMAELFYSGAGEQVLLDHFERQLRASHDEYKKEEEFQADLLRFPTMLHLWFEKMSERLEEYEVLMTERELRPHLGDSLGTMTIRPDAVLRHKSTRRVYVAEHKTTSYSLQGMISSVETEDQITAYCWGLTKACPELKADFGGVLLDVTYQKGRVTDFAQEVLFRNRFALEDFELSMIGLFNEVTSKVAALRKNPALPPPLLFPRNGSCCSRWPCEYEAICRNRVRSDDPMGADFELDPLANMDELLDSQKLPRDLPSQVVEQAK